jgi:hypothetical protein
LAQIEGVLDERRFILENFPNMQLCNSDLEVNRCWKKEAIEKMLGSKNTPITLPTESLHSPIQKSKSHEKHRLKTLSKLLFTQSKQNFHVNLNLSKYENKK